MNVFEIKGIDNEVNLDGEHGVFTFYGRFLPQKTKDFFEPILVWLEEYSKNPYRKSVIIFKMDYFNTSSSKKFLDILIVFQDIQLQGFEVEVEWCYHKDDIDIKDAGKGYANLVELPFIYKEF